MGQLVQFSSKLCFPACVLQLSKRMEELNDKTVCADSDLRADMERWHRSKHKDMKELFMGMADRQIKHYEKVSGSS